MDFKAELDLCIRARFALITIVTLEEERALDCVKQVSNMRQRPYYSWDAADGLKRHSQSVVRIDDTKDPLAALQYIEQASSEAVFVLKDFHSSWEDEIVRRKLRTVAQELKYTKKSIVIISPSTKIPVELKNLAVVLEFPLPSEEELDEALQMLEKTPGVELSLAASERKILLQAAQGLTTAQALRVFAKAIVSNGVLDENDVHVITDQKREIIRDSEALEFYASNQSLQDVGGLDSIKEWLRMRGRAFGSEAKDYGLPSPKGIALIGIPGTGKSLTAKLIGSMWKLPLLRLDVGALFGSYIGESEERARRALRVAEAISPCIVWIDEMEKALAHGGNDSGTSTRVFGTILTWMQEKTSPCFVVATANNISKLPPELLRRGRFDEIFFLDLPNSVEREAIFSVHFKKRDRKPSDFDINRLVELSSGYVGAEIEQAIIDGMYLGFDSNREFTTDDVIDALKRMVPMSVSQRETITQLRKWLTEGRARPASAPIPRKKPKTISSPKKKEIALEDTPLEDTVNNAEKASGENTQEKNALEDSPEQKLVSTSEHG
jgi:ATP-dependent 26S proteasome regulatory subunit